MANITIVSTANSLQIDFGDYAAVLEETKGVWVKSNILSFREKTWYVEVNIIEEKQWHVSFDGAVDTFQIDLINTVAPTTNADLFLKLQALIA